MENAVNGFAHMTPRPPLLDVGWLGRSCFSSSWEGAERSPHSSPLVKSRFSLDSEVKRCTMRVNHGPIISSSLTAASALPPLFVPRRHLSAAYLFIRLTVCADRIKKSGNVALQQPWSVEISLGCGARPPCPAISLRYRVLLFTFSLHTRARLQHMGERWESPRKALGRSCQMRLRNFKSDLPVNLISRGEPARLLTVCRTGAKQQVLHL